MEVSVRPPEELIPAADREHRSALAGRLQHAGGLREQVLRDERLFAILPAADVEEIVLARATGSPIETGLTSSSWPRHAARRDRTAMLPRSA